jgi:MoaA/NifB/PqqE/SkfB family radical SAM enzyme
VLNGNAWRGREFIPAQRELLCVETSSICNLNCRICGYGKKQSPRLRMPDALFHACIDQAVDMGIQRFQLTPMTGDVFMDPRFMDRLEFLDSHPKVKSYEFFTNFTIPNEARIEHLFGLKKLRQLVVSIYGHDVDSFVAIAQSEPRIYRRLLNNLESLYQRLEQRRFHLEFGLRTVRRISSDSDSDLLRILERFREAGIRTRRSRVYNNWGGLVSNADVEGLDIEITTADAVYKKGVCTMMFTDVQVMATGVVNACACRDVDATLRIGNLKEQPLREIFSRHNQAYMTLVQEQQEGYFRSICRSCDFYKSIYRKRSSNRGQNSLTLDEFMERLG